MTTSRFGVGESGSGGSPGGSAGQSGSAGVAGRAGWGGTGSGGTCALALVCDGECIENDDEHCGSCTNDCTRLPHVAAGQSHCEVSESTLPRCTFLPSACDPGYGHCGGEPSTGCETDITTAAHCGTCSTSCDSAGPTPLCAPAPWGFGYTCVSDCQGPSQETSCADEKDDDCDRLVDCDDPDCAKATNCAPPAGCVPEFPFVQEVWCGDDKDNDCDSK